MATENAQSQTGTEKTEMQKIPSETEPCWKKKAANEGFLATMKEHLDEFVNTSMDQHKICLKKTIEGVGSRFRTPTSVRVDDSLLYNSLEFRACFDYVYINPKKTLFGLKAENDLGVEEVESSKKVQSTTTQ